jgi:hypothetical protein
MSFRRVLTGALAGAAVLGGPLVTTGIASASECPPDHPKHEGHAPAAPIVYAPVNAPTNVCGNTVNVIGSLNPAYGNTCTNS